MEARLTQLSEDVQGLSQQLNPSARQDNHISHFVIHPDVVNSDAAGSSLTNQCPVCYKLFDNWSGYYMLACGHYYHLVCLVRIMQTTSTCSICHKEIPEGPLLCIMHAKRLQAATCKTTHS